MWGGGKREGGANAAKGTEGWARPPRVPLHLPPTDEFTTYYGTASPPTSYGGYGGNAKESAK